MKKLMLLLCLVIGSMTLCSGCGKKDSKIINRHDDDKEAEEWCRSFLANKCDWIDWTEYHYQGYTGIDRKSFDILQANSLYDVHSVYIGQWDEDEDWTMRVVRYDDDEDHIEIWAYCDEVDEVGMVSFHK